MPSCSAQLNAVGVLRQVDYVSDWVDATFLPKLRRLQSEILLKMACTAIKMTSYYLLKYFTIVIPFQ